MIQKRESTLNASTIPDDKRLIVIQRNPRSGSGAGRKELLNLVRALRTAQYRVRMFRSREKLDAYLSIERNQQQLRCLVAAGGDGVLNVRVYHGTSRWQIFWHAVRLKLRQPIRAVEVTKFTAKQLMLDSPDNVQIDGVQVDGDPCSSLPVEVDVRPASLYLLVF